MNTESAFSRFELAFKVLNARVRNATGVTFFTSARDMGDGIVQVTCTDTWKSGPTVDRRANLNTLLDLWKTAEGTDLPVAVFIVDERGQPVMDANAK